MINYLSTKAKRKVMAVLAASAILLPASLSTNETSVEAAKVNNSTYEVTDIAFSVISGYE